MAQIFHPATNAFAKGTIFGFVFILAGIAWAGGLFVRSSYVTEVEVVRDQPVPFSHDHHVSGLGLDCRYCHTTVEKSAFAGIPSTEICMGCHSQIWNDSPLLAPVRNSFASGKPLQWTRVHDLPDFVYFNHSIHVAKGVACESCHGRVDRMPLMRKTVSLHMEWCLDCHRHPEVAVRDKADVYKFGHSQAHLFLEESGAVEPVTKREGARSGENPSLIQRYGIVKKQLSDCVICHR